MRSSQSVLSRLLSPRLSTAGEEKAVGFPAALSWLSLGAAAIFAFGTLYYATEYVEERTEAAKHRELASLADLEVRSLKQSLEAEKIVSDRRIADLERAGDVAELKVAKLSPLNRNAGEAMAIAVWNPFKQQGVLTVEKLSPLQPTEEYQLWIVDPRYPDPVSNGVFSVRGDGTTRFVFHPVQPITGATHFAISREKKGGVAKPEGPIVAAGAL